jgi:predicted 3-demethylubiquinone-9 3-methyltransferase (glyoxalase superfamily)
MARSITPFLMFEGSAEEAMTFYVGLFPGSAVGEVARYGGCSRQLVEIRWPAGAFSRFRASRR